MTDTEVVEELVERWEDGRAAGRAPETAELCRDHPRLAGRVGRELDLLRRMAWVDREFEHTGGGGRPGGGGQPGDVLDDRYRLEAPAGAGGFGVVWRATDLRHGGTVAVKLPLGAAADAGWADYAPVARLVHTNIVPVCYVGKRGNQYYLVTEFMAGGSVAGLLRGGPVGASRARQIARDIAAGLAYLHRHGLIHRDLKPANVLLDRDGRACVADFGTAVRTTPGLAVVVPPAGTPAYMAPEQLRANTPIDHRCDLYALGVILFELLAGHRPLARRAASELLARLRGEVPPDLSAVGVAAPAHLEEVVRRCLAADPRDRYATADEVFEALGGAARSGSRPPPRRPEPAAPPPDPPAPPTPRRAWSVAPVARAAAITLVVGGTLMALAWAAAPGVRRAVPADPRLVLLAVVGVCAAAGLAVVGRGRSVAVLAVVAAGTAVGFWLTGFGYDLWQAVAAALTRIRPG